MNNKIVSFFACIILFLSIFSGVIGEVGAYSDDELEIFAKHNDQVLIRYKNSEKIGVLDVSENENIETVMNSLSYNPLVDFVEPNYTYKASIIPTDTYYKNQWYLNKIKAPEAWNEVRESEGIIIAVIDTGVQITHPDLKDNIWVNKKEIPNNGIDDDKNGFIDDVNGWDFVNGVADPSPKFSDGFTQDGIFHGTIVAGVAAASGNNASGITGVTWRAEIMPLKVLDDKGEGNTKNVVKAIDYAIRNGADIINLSFVGFGYSLNLKEAIERAYRQGVIIVAAAGNEEGGGEGVFLDETPMYPVCYDGESGENMVIGVAATDALDQKAYFSGYGTKCIDISAPGVSIFSTAVYEPAKGDEEGSFNNYYEGYWSGTSMAAPMVSGAIALIEAANPAIRGDEAVGIMMDSADNISRLNPSHLGQMGSGRLNLFNSVSKAKSILFSRESKLLIAPFQDYVSEVSIRGSKGDTEKTFQVFNENFRGGVNVASGDVNGDGIDEIIAGAGFSGGPHVRVFDQNGNLISQFFAYNQNFRGGVNVSAGDVNGDGIDEIIAGAGFSGGPHVRVFDQNGNLISQFFAYNQNFRGGVNVAAGDVNGDGIDEIVTGSGFGGGPQVRMFKGDGSLEGQFFAYDENFRGGVRVAIANLGGGTNGNKGKIITVPGKTGSAEIKIFDNHANVLDKFFAYHEKFKGGATLAVADIDRDGVDEIVTGAGPGGGPHVKIFYSDGSLLGSFYAYDESFGGGVSVGSIQVKN